MDQKRIVLHISINTFNIIIMVLISILTSFEGWHHRLNRSAGYQPLTFYRLVPVLRAEAENVSYELRHLGNGSATRRVRPTVNTVEKKIQTLWDQYSSKTIDTSALLAGCAEVYGPQCESPLPSEPIVTHL